LLNQLQYIVIKAIYLEVLVRSQLEKSIKEISTDLEQLMGEMLPDEDYGLESRLFNAMRYSVLTPGKRLRPFLTVVSSRLFGVSPSSALNTAAAIEFIHTYSLIHDDLPAFDNDDFRRGQPSCHKKFDEATAILAGDALLTYAFEILSDPETHSDSNVRCELIKSVAKASGAKGGMVGGQMMDLLSDNKELTINEITRLQRMKTGMLFAVSCEAGAILGKASQNLRVALRGYAHMLGLAFQITDDILDYKSVDNDNEKRENKSAHKPTYITSMGLEKASEQVAMLADQAISHLEPFTNKADLLRDLARYIVTRDS
jgi:farnesyl diphosphate synthase